MEQIQKLPIAAKIAIPAVLLLVIGVLVWATMMRPVDRVLAKSSGDAGQIQAAKVVLTRANVSVEAKSGSAGEFELWVPKKQATQAREALAATGLQGRLDAKSKKDCGTAPGITATSSDRNKHDNCKNEQAIEQSVLGLNGVLSATATVTRQESSDVFGDMTAKVTVQVFVREEARQQFVQNITGLAGMIANMVEGASSQTVMIQDGNGGGLFYDGSSRKSRAGAAAGTSASSAGGCTSLREQFTDITAKEQAIKECYEQDLGSKIASYAGGDEHYTLLVTPKVNGSSKEIVINRPLKGVPTSTNRNKSSGNGQSSSSSDTSNITGQKTTTQSIAPGDVSSLRISAALDSRTVTPAEEKAVRDMLTDVMASTATKSKPSITRFPFTGANGQPAPQAPPANANGTNDDGVGTGAAAAPQPTMVPSLVGKAGMSKALIALMAILVIGLLTAIAVLWRRSTRMAADRVRYESEFRNEQRLFENFAQQNPDDIARDLEALFGAPAADPRTHA